MVSAISFGDANAGFQAGIVNGPVSTAFHLPPERLETPPPPSIVIPFACDPDFVERGTILEQVDQICAVPGARVALVGLGGVGKSQLAIEHAYRTRERSPETWVFWVHASNAARFEQSFRDIADRAKIAGRRDPQANIFKLVHGWLCDCKERWLLVLDNVDDARFLLDIQAHRGGQATKETGASRPLREYLPHCERGSILVTTRSKEAALKLAEQRNILSIEPMDRAEGLALFEKKLGAQEDSSDVAELAAALEYLDEFEKNERKRTGLLNYDEAHLRRDWEAKNSIIVTWEISFEYIQQTRPSAADLLSLMSFFDRQGVPEYLLQRRATPDLVYIAQKEKKGGDTDSDSEDSTSQLDIDDSEFEEDVTVLRNFCFISTNPNGITFEMHALVQLATRRWLTANNKLELWKQQFITRLRAAFPVGEYENWAACQALYAHAKAAIGQRPEDELAVAEWATVLYRAAWFAERTGKISDAEVLATKAMKARKKVLGQGHEDTVQSIAMVGSVYRLGGRWDDAEALEAQVMKTRKTKLGADHPDTLASINNLAWTYSNQGRWDDAETLFVQVMETRKTKLGADHSDTLASMAHLASTYWNQGRWDEAEVLEVQVMETFKTKLGAEHPHTLSSMANLAFTWKAQGRTADAIASMRQCLQRRQRVLKASHPDIQSSLAALEQWEAE